jgi:hypothetical protein
MASLQKVGFPAAIYANLFDQQAGQELWNLFLSAPEMTGTRNDQSVKIRKLGAFTAAAYGGAGSIDPTTDYQRPSDTTIEVLFDETALVPVGVDNIEMEMTALGVEGSRSALAQDAASAVRDFIVTEMLVTAEAGATAVSAPVAGATISAEVLINAGRDLDANKVPKTNRVAVLDSSRNWDLYDETSKIGFDNREFASMIREGVTPRLFGFDIYDTTLMPANTNGLFFHQSAVIAKVVDAAPNVKLLPDPYSIGDLLQIYLRYGKKVADGNRIVKHKTV